MTTWSIGQNVIVRHRTYRGPARVTEETVSRVGRKYFYVDMPGGELAFEIETGRERENGTNYSATAFTPEGYAEAVAHEKANERLRGLTQTWGWIGRLTTEQMNAISDVIEASR